MYLKKIELHGFKSFADKSVIEFQPGITGIVGPNGCGKSNIADAVRWVLGEQSVKSLRGSSMSDVIFNGSEDRKAQNVAEVTLVFDNQDRFMNIDYNEVEITRRIYRQNNEAEYLINREPCRLKDIVDLIMDTGLGRDSLSIISQGNISTFADSKPEERRGMFEEAAGVAKYKKRKLESIRKLERTSDNLARLEDTYYDLEKRIGPLEKQKIKAEQYLELKEELQSVEVSVLVKEIEGLSNELEKLNKSLESLNEDKVSTDAEILINEQQTDILKKKMFDLDNEINTLQGRLFDAMTKMKQLETEKVRVDESRKHLLASLDINDVETRLVQLEAILKDAIVEYNNRLERYNNAKEDKLKYEALIEKNRLELNDMTQTIENLNIQLNNNRMRKQQLLEQSSNKSHYSHGVKVIMNAKDSLNGIVGVLGDLIETNDQYEAALNTALAGASLFVVTKTNEDARNAISFLKKNKSGRATFLPIDTMKERSIREDHVLVLNNCKGYLGIMSDFVQYPMTIKNIVSNQLGNIIVADTIDHATYISKATFARYKIVTLDGDVVNVGGSLTGGSSHMNSNSFLVKKELEKITSIIEKQEKEFIEKRKNRTELENKAAEISQTLTQKQMTFARLEFEVKSKQNDVYKAKNDFDNVKGQKSELSEIESGTKENELIHALNKAKSEYDDIVELIQTKRDLRMNFVNENEKNEEKLRVLRKQIRMIQNQLTEVEVNKSKNEKDINYYLVRLNEEYKMTYEHAKNEYYRDIDMLKSKEEVRLLRHKIESLGHVNLNSIDEYKEIKERYETLGKQRFDLINAQDSLLKAIDEMDEIMIKRFSETFEKINKEFNIVFRNLFGGGRAELKYSDPSNILETGIDIDVQPPGKAVQNITLFSGGEKALIAISCLFAILRVRPVPMCILDEVEAALDVANVERFAKYLKEFSNTSQFIVVTHREGTMEECDLLYGATMQKKGVTKLVSVKIKDAIDLAQS